MKCDVMFLWDSVDNKKVLQEITIKEGIDAVKYVKGSLLWCVLKSGATKSGIMKLVGTKLYYSNVIPQAFQLVDEVNSQMTIRNCNTLRKLYALMKGAK